MKSVQIYTTPSCGFCMRAKRLLERKSVTYEEVHILKEPSRREEMMTRSGGYTVPQIFIDGEAIGGCNELYALENAGKLDDMLGVA